MGALYRYIKLCAQKRHLAFVLDSSLLLRGEQRTMLIDTLVDGFFCQDDQASNCDGIQREWCVLSDTLPCLVALSSRKHLGKHDHLLHAQKGSESFDWWVDLPEVINDLPVFASFTIVTLSSLQKWLTCARTHGRRFRFSVDCMKWLIFGTWKVWECKSYKESKTEKESERIDIS